MITSAKNHRAKTLMKSAWIIKVSKFMLKINLIAKRQIFIDCYSLHGRKKVKGKIKVK